MALPALLLGAAALAEIRNRRKPEVLRGRWLAIVAMAGGVFFLMLGFVLPLAVIIPGMRDYEMSGTAERVRSLVNAQQWEAALAEHEKVAKANATDAMWWLRKAPLEWRADSDDYPAFCRAALAQFAELRSATEAERIAKACLLAPTPPDVLGPAGRLSEFAVAEGADPSLILWFYATRGLALYRQGDFAGALELGEICRAGDPEDAEQRRSVVVYAVTAMAEQRLGNQQQAKRWLQQSERLLRARPALDDDWHDHVIGEILVAEARRIVDGK